MLGRIDEREGHRERVRRQQNPPPPRCQAPEEECDEQRVGRVQGRHRRHLVRVPGAPVEERVEVRDRDVVPDVSDRAGRRLERSELAGHPGRRRREEGVRREAHEREKRHHRDEAAKQAAGEEPEEAGHEVRRQEVAHVDDPGGVVVPLQVQRAVPEVLLEPDRRRRASEENLVSPQLRVHVRREEKAVGVATQVVVGPEDERERNPLEDHAGDPAAEVGQREREQTQQDPHEQPVA